MHLENNVLYNDVGICPTVTVTDWTRIKTLRAVFLATIRSHDLLNRRKGPYPWATRSSVLISGVCTITHSVETKTWHCCWQLICGDAFSWLVASCGRSFVARILLLLISVWNESNNMQWALLVTWRYNTEQKCYSCFHLSVLPRKPYK